MHCAKVMEELKMNRSEIFNFAVRRCLYFTFICEQFKSLRSTGDLTAYTPRYRTCEETETPSQFKSYDTSTFIVSYTIFHNSRYRYPAVSWMER